MDIIKIEEVGCVTVQDFRQALTPFISHPSRSHTYELFLPLPIHCHVNDRERFFSAYDDIQNHFDRIFDSNTAHDSVLTHQGLLSFLLSLNKFLSEVKL